MARLVTIGLKPESAKLEYNGDLELEFTAAHQDILEHFSVAEVINHFGIADLIDEIGQKEACDHFGLVEAE